MNSSRNNQNCEGRNSTPFFYVPPMTQQPLLGPWYQTPTYNPICIPGAGFTNGSLYFPYPVVFNAYPGFLVPLSPLPTALNQRPVVPLFYNMAPQYGGYWERMKTKDTQTETEPQQAENLDEKPDMPSEGDSRDTGRVTSNPTNTFSSENVGEKEEVDSSSYPEGCVPSPTWLAQVNKVDETTQGDMKKCCDAQFSQSPESSSERSKGPWWRHSDSFESDNNYSDSYEEYFHSPVMPAPAPLPRKVGEGVQLQEKPQQMPSGGESHGLCERCHSSPLSTVYRVDEGIQCDIRKDAEQMESGNQNEDEDEYEDEVENNYEDHAFSPPWLAQLSKVNEGIQCDIRKDAEQMESGNQDEGEYEDEAENNYEEHGFSPTWEVQFSEVNEGIQCGMSWLGSQLENYPHQRPSRGKETLLDCRTKSSWKKTVMNRKSGIGEDAMIVKDETGEVYSENFKGGGEIKKTVRGRKLKGQSSFSNLKTVCLLKKGTALNIVNPEDSGDSELGEEVEDQVNEVECLFEEVSLQSPLTASKGRSYQEAGRMTRVPPESSVPPQLIVRPTRNKYKLLQVHGGNEHIPEAYHLEQQDGWLRSKPTMARLEGLASRRASHK